MAGVLQLTRAEADALEQAGVGGCAECQRAATPFPRRPAPERGAPALAPRTYVLRFHEFVNYAAVRNVWGAGAALMPARWREAEATSVVYVFRRLARRTTLWHQGRGGGTLTLTVRPEEAGASYYVCLSRFALPAERLRQYTAPGEDAFALVRARCRALDLADAALVRPAGGGAYDVVLCDHRRVATELHARETNEFAAYDAFALDPARVRRQYLAAAALDVTRSFGKKDPKAWGWVRHAAGPAPARRLPGLAGRPYTAPEAELLRGEREVTRRRAAVEQWASAKYAWMRQPAYREMCYDALRSPDDQRVTVLDEGALFDRATETAAGQAFLREYAIRAGTWYTRYLLHPLPYEREQTRTVPAVADAYWTILGAVTAARLGEAERQVRGPDAAVGSPLDPVKNQAGVADDRLKQASDAAGKEREAMEQAATLAGADAALAHDAARRAAAAAASYDAVHAGWSEVRAIVMTSVVAASVRAHVGVALPVAGVSEETGLFVPAPRVGVLVPADAPAARHPDLDAWRTEARGAAAARARTAGAAEGRLRSLRVRLVDTEELERAYAGRAWLTTRALLVLSTLNVGLAVKAWREEPGWESRTKLGGAVADLLYGFEFAFVQQQATGQPLMRGLGRIAPRTGIITARALGALGGAISTWYAATDALRYGAKGETNLARAGGVAALGSLALTTGAVSGLATAWLGEAVLGSWWATVGAGLTSTIGAVLLAAGSVYIALHQRPPLEDWLKECTWGMAPKGDADAKQLERFFKLVCTPNFRAEYGPLSPHAVHHTGQPGIELQLRPPVFLPGESVLDVDLGVHEVTFDPRTGPRRRVVAVAVRVAVGPVPSELFEAARAAEIPLRHYARLGGAAAGARPVAATLDARGGAPLVRLYLALDRPLARPALELFGHAYQVRGEARLTLATRARQGALGQFRLDPMPVGPADVQW